MGRHKACSKVDELGFRRVFHRDIGFSYEDEIWKSLKNQDASLNTWNKYLSSQRYGMGVLQKQGWKRERREKIYLLSKPCMV